MRGCTASHASLESVCGASDPRSRADTESVIQRISALGTVPREAGSERTIEIGALLDIFDGDAAEVADLLRAAKRSLEIDLARIERAAAAGDRDALIEAVHRLKGTSGSTFAHRVRSVGTAIERVARVTGVAAALPFLPELRAATLATVAAIDEFA